MTATRIVGIPDGHAVVMRWEGDSPDCELAPRKYERHTSRIGGTSGGLGRGGHTRNFWSKVKKVGLAPGGCWEWIGYRDPDGYGKLTTVIDGRVRTVRPHRHLYEQMRDPIPPGLYLLHDCDNPACVNPWHLRPGTQSENIRACYERGRHTDMPDNRGELGPNAKLDNDAVLFIRSQPQRNGVCMVLARIYGVSVHHIRAIRCRACWKHLGNGNSQNAMTFAQLCEIASLREEQRLPKQTRMSP